MADSSLPGASIEYLQAARASALALRDKAFLEIAHQKDLLRQHTEVLSDVNAELAFRVVDKKRAEIAEEIKPLRGRARLHLLLRLLRLYLFTRYVTPIVAKPIFSGATLVLSFRMDLGPDYRPGDMEPWVTIRLNALGERLIRSDRRGLQRDTCLLTTHPRNWGF